MAAKASSKKRDPVTCEDLLEKLRKGQNELKSSMKGYIRGGEGGSTAVNKRRETKINRRKVLFERPLNRVDDLPRKRARLVQLSSDHLSPAAAHEPRTKASKVHVRRLSSTPKQMGALSPRPAPPSLDVSLEGEMLSKGKQKRESKVEKKQQMTSSSWKSSQGGEYPTHLPSPKMSRIVVDTSRTLPTPGSSKKRSSSGVVKGVSPSPARSNKKKRGLSVSFIDNDEESPSVLKRKKGNLRPKSHHSRTKQDLGTSLIESLNSSRYGALDRSLSQTRKQGRFPRKYTGGDPRLGYDWIAGLLDSSEGYLSEKDNEYFEDIKEFRQVNHADCFRPKEALLPGSLEGEGEGEGEGSSDDDETSSHNQDLGHDQCTTCVSSYVINDRLFPVLLHSSSGEDSLGVRCPVCEGKYSHDEPPTRFVRVSVPRSVLQTSYKVRAHRRRSFDPTDSMGLSKHCLAGWENAQPSVILPQSKVDLKSAVKSTGSGKKVEGQKLLNTSHFVEYSLRSRAAGRQ